MRTYVYLLSGLFFLQNLSAASLHIGMGFPYANLEEAAANATPGDTIFFHEGIHSGGQYVANLKGTFDNWIYIKNAHGCCTIRI